MTLDLDQLSTWLGMFFVVGGLVGAVYPVWRNRERDVQDKAAETLATMQAHRITVVEHERDDAFRARDQAVVDRDAERLNRRAAEAERDHYKRIIERAINREIVEREVDDR